MLQTIKIVAAASQKIRLREGLVRGVGWAIGAGMGSGSDFGVVGWDGVMMSSQ